ncbi:MULTISPECIES: maleylacetoacetate isomerase [Dyella]|uniref:Maleylacetoacetate isomerase n=2 Tax=Dyella TaxID=231454 RepID=A0A4R0YYD3_9GAMM|nr:MULTISPECIES: maleylacetoacetate isomerase [Dyella]TBR40379.1 maleylacetoacetate isomerase [Dyella terrae]TCI12038.1 maleylacetoacetate isomerase [Dyella soli]
MTADLVLYGYWRSSAAYRVRIALNLKGLAYESRAVHLVKDGGEQHSDRYRALNPQELVPCLIHGDQVLTQSMAIMEYLDDAFPASPLLPNDAGGRARVRALAQLVACDIHPIGNLRVLQYLGSHFNADDAVKGEWSRHWIGEGFKALETMLASSAQTGRFCHGDTPSLADACLVPQYYNATRWKLPMDAFPTIQRVVDACNALDAFAQASPEAQPDAPPSH